MTPNAYATGTDASTAARPKSAPIITLRRRTRSSQTPAAIPRTFGSVTAVEIAATSNAEAWSTRIAVSGRARRVTWLPTALMPAADHTRMKSACRQSPCSGATDFTARAAKRRGLRPQGFAESKRDAIREAHDPWAERNVLSCAVGPAARIANTSGPASSGCVRPSAPSPTLPLARRSSARANSASV